MKKFAATILGRTHEYVIIIEARHEASARNKARRAVDSRASVYNVEEIDENYVKPEPKRIY